MNRSAPWEPIAGNSSRRQKNPGENSYKDFKAKIVYFLVDTIIIYLVSVVLEDSMASVKRFFSFAVAIYWSLSWNVVM